MFLVCVVTVPQLVVSAGLEERNLQTKNKLQ